MYVKEPADHQCHVLVKFCGGKLLTSDKVQGDLRACDGHHGQISSLIPYIPSMYPTDVDATEGNDSDDLFPGPVDAAIRVIAFGGTGLLAINVNGVLLMRHLR